MTYDGITATNFEITGRGVNGVTPATANDDATIKLASFTDDVFSGF